MRLYLEVFMSLTFNNSTNREGMDLESASLGVCWGISCGIISSAWGDGSGRQKHEMRMKIRLVNYQERVYGCDLL